MCFYWKIGATLRSQTTAMWSAQPVRAWRWPSARSPCWAVAPAQECCSIWMPITAWRNACVPTIVWTHRLSISSCVRWGKQLILSTCIRLKPGAWNKVHINKQGFLCCQPVKWQVWKSLLIPPLPGTATFVPRLCDHRKRKKKWPGRRWRHKGGQKAVQGLHRGRSTLAMDAMVAVKFWACSKQSHKGRRGCRSLKGGRRKAHASAWSQNGRTGVGHWSTCKKNAYCCIHCVSIWAMLLLPCTTIVLPLANR